LPPPYDCDPPVVALIGAVVASEGTLMRAYVELARAGWRRYATYRASTLAGVFTNTMFGFLRAAVLVAALGTAGTIAGWDTKDALTYTWLGQGLLMVVHMWNWNDLALRVQTGDVATDLQRPVDFQGMWLATDYGRAGYQLFARGLPPFVVGALVYTLRVPEDPTTWLLFAVSLVLAVTISFAIRFLVNVSAFWLLDWRGPLTMANVLASALSGFMVPIAFYPAWAATLLRALPWAAFVQAPIDIFLERPEASHWIWRQCVWAVVLLAAGRAVMAVATRKLVVQGG
jgi:ABC-2 type transport system permease protein